MNVNQLHDSLSIAIRNNLKILHEELRRYITDCAAHVAECALNDKPVLYIEHHKELIKMHEKFLQCLNESYDEYLQSLKEQ